MRSTKNIYSLPLPRSSYIKKVVTESPGHLGPYKGAIDFAVEAGTDVLAPCGGEVITAIDINEQYGADPKYAKFTNYVQIAHANGETSDLMHLAQGSIVVRKGDIVNPGQKIAKTGFSGYMTAPHLHWFVFKRDNSPEAFHGLQIQCEELSLLR